MRVAVFTDVFPALSETFITRQIVGLMELGHKVHIYAQGRPESGVPLQPEVAAHNLLGHTTYMSIPRASGYWEMPVLPPSGQTWLPGASQPIPNLRRLLHALPRLARTFAAAPRVTLSTLNPREYGYAARSLSAMYRVSELLGGRGEYDVAQAHFGPVADKVRFVPRLWQVPLIASFHGYDVSAWPREKGAGVYERLFHAATLVTANSHYTKQRLEALGCPPHKIRVLRMGLDLGKFTFRERSAPDDGCVRILSVGRLVEKKGFEYSIRAMTQVRARHPQVQYGIVGDGPLRSRLDALVTSLGLEGTVRFYGAAGREFVRRRLDEAHIFVAPSVTSANGDVEGQGLVLQEAQACGIPVLATDHNGFPEGMLPGQSGFLVPERSAPDIAERLEYMIEHPHRWAEWGRAGRRHVEEHFDIALLSRQLEGLYKEARHIYMTGKGRK
ncbi:MAG: glycosyltransferase [Chloroflexota bacterium]|nr:glycosyltransferase [Chloroflexota bacterium]MDQ5864723.1 glycosyltransferase [Chloroflexota bacterium]